MKRFLFAISFLAAAYGALGMAPTPAKAGLFGGKPKPSPTASPTPLPMPTASPEPPSIAIPKLEQRLKANPNDRVAMLDLAQEFLSIGRPEVAVTLTQHLLQLGTKTAQVYYLDASAQESLNNLTGAVTDLENASDLEPTNLGVLSALASMYIKANRLSDAERVANRAITFNKTQPQAYVTLGQVYAAEKKWDAARAEFEQAYTLDPTDVSPLMQEASTWVLQQDVPNAVTVVDRAITVDPKNVQLLVYRADLYAKENDVPKASAAFDDAVAAATTDPDRAGVMVQKALMFAGMKQQAQAQATFESAIQEYPLVSAVHVAYGEYFMNQHNQTQAQVQFLAALQVNKNDVNALFDMAQLKQMQGHTTDAIGYLKQLSQIAPSAQTFGLLGQAYISLRDYGDAKNACAKSFQIDRTPDALSCIAGSDYSLKNYKEAGQIFGILDSQAKPYMDRNPQMLYMMGATYTQLHQNGKAVDAYRRLLKLLKPGTKQYKQIEHQVAMLSRPAPRKQVKKHK